MRLNALRPFPIVFVFLICLYGSSGQAGDKGALAYWPMNEGAGRIIRSQPDGSFWGGMSGDIDWLRDGERGFLAFSGGSCRIDLNHLQDFNASAPFSLFCTIRGGSRGTVMGRWGIANEDKDFVLGVDKEYQLTFSVNTPQGLAIVRGENRLTEDKWYICGAVADGNRLSVYVDGLDSSPAFVSYSPFPEQNGQNRPPLLIGDSSWFGHLSGAISEFSLYDRALETPEILALSRRNRIAKRLGAAENLLYFSFASPRLKDIDAKDVSIIEQSPFTGIALRLTGAYDMPDLRIQEYRQAMDLLRERAVGKKIWPVIFFNYLYGSPYFAPCERTMREQEKLHDLAKTVNGLDLKNERQAFDYLKESLTLSLTIAKEIGSPGLFIDPEAYNCYDAYQITELAARHGLSPDQVIFRLREMGAAIADIVDAVYAEAVLFFYIIDFGDIQADGYERSIVYIAEGMLRRAKEGGYPLKVVDGWTGRYLYDSMASLEYEARRAIAKKAAYLERYPNLEISGVVAPFEAYDALPSGSWIKERLDGRQNNGKALSFARIEDFLPVYRYLLTNFKWVWLYGANQGNHDIFSDDIPDKYWNVLEQALAQPAESN